MPVPSSCFTHSAHLEEAVAGAGPEPLGGPALVVEPSLQRVRAQVLLHHEEGAAVWRQSVEPAGEQVVQGLPCRCGSAGSTRAGRPRGPPARRRARPPGRWRDRALAALARHSSTARPLTSTAHTVAPGARGPACTRSARTRSRGRRRCPSLAVRRAPRAAGTSCRGRRGRRRRPPGRSRGRANGRAGRDAPPPGATDRSARHRSSAPLRHPSPRTYRCHLGRGHSAPISCTHVRAVRHPD